MAKKKLKAKLPKRIAGVKVPKAMRKGALGQFLGSPAGQAIIVDAVMQAGRSAMKAEGGKGSALRSLAERYGGELAHAGKGAKHGAKHAGEVGAAGAVLAFALGEAARAFVHALHSDREPTYQPGWQAPAPGQSSAAELLEEEPSFTKKKAGFVGRAGPLDQLTTIPAGPWSQPPVVVHHPVRRGRLKGALSRLALRTLSWAARAKAAHELKGLEKGRGGQQTLRAFIQINIQPRPR